MLLPELSIQLVSHLEVHLRAYPIYQASVIPGITAALVHIVLKTRAIYVCIPCLLLWAGGLDTLHMLFIPCEGISFQQQNIHVQC